MITTKQNKGKRTNWVREHSVNYYLEFYWFNSYVVCMSDFQFPPKQKSKNYTSTYLILFQTISTIVYTVRTKKGNYGELIIFFKLVISSQNTESYYRNQTSLKGLFLITFRIKMQFFSISSAFDFKTRAFYWQVSCIGTDPTTFNRKSDYLKKIYILGAMSRFVFTFHL